MAVDFSNAISQATDEDYLMEVGMVLGGAAGAVAIDNVGNGMDLGHPPELPGVLVALGALSVDRPNIALGGGVHAGVQAAERVGVRGTIEGLGGGN
jgi:hypothetical protein